MAIAEESPPLPIDTLHSYMLKPSPSISSSFMHVLLYPTQILLQYSLLVIKGTKRDRVSGLGSLFVDILLNPNALSCLLTIEGDISWIFTQVEERVMSS